MTVFTRCTFFFFFSVRQKGIVGPKAVLTYELRNNDDGDLSNLSLHNIRPASSIAQKKREHCSNTSVLYGTGAALDLSWYLARSLVHHGTGFNMFETMR